MDTTQQEFAKKCLATALHNLKNVVTQLDFANSFTPLGSDLEREIEELEASARSLGTSIKRVKEHINATTNEQE